VPIASRVHAGARLVASRGRSTLTLGIMTRRSIYLSLAVTLSTVHFLTFMHVFGLAIYFGDAGRPPPWWLTPTIDVLGAPGIYSLLLIGHYFGDSDVVPYVVFCLNSILWGTVLAWIATGVRRHAA